MRAARFVAWALLALWSTWLFAIQGYLCSQGGLLPWVPDMGLVLLLMLDRRNSVSSMAVALAIVASARIAFSADPALAIVFGYGLLVACMRVLRRAVVIDHPMMRAAFAGLGFLALNKYWAMARGISLASAGLVPSAAGVWSGELPAGSWGMALATSLCILLLGPPLMRLPGLSPLRKGDL